MKRVKQRIVEWIRTTCRINQQFGHVFRTLGDLRLQIVACESQVQLLKADIHSTERFDAAVKEAEDRLRGDLLTFSADLKSLASRFDLLKADVSKAKGSISHEPESTERPDAPLGGFKPLSVRKRQYELSQRKETPNEQNSRAVRKGAS